MFLNGTVLHNTHIKVNVSFASFYIYLDILVYLMLLSIQMNFVINVVCITIHFPS